jgi:site-specific recombinase XerD
MTPYKNRKCKLTQRLAEDMMIRNLAEATIDAYTYHVRKFADFIEKPLDSVTTTEPTLWMQSISAGRSEVRDRSLAATSQGRQAETRRFAGPSSLR